MLCLEGQQASLSWITVLKKREAYREHFFKYSIETIASFSDEQLQAKLEDERLIRHIGKLKAIRDNATAWQHLTQQLKQQQNYDKLHNSKRKIKICKVGLRYKRVQICGIN